ncbi:VP3 [Gokushovirus WZ-2015a]|nr:VP3 [Gokushovirus WZ-2015a]
MPFVRSAFNYDRREASIESGLACTDETRTQQQFREECDINTIVRRFGLGYEMPQGVRVPMYGDFTHLSDYHEACNAIAEAHENFDLFPAELRARFQNNPGNLIDFMADERNREEAVRLGLVNAPPISSPTSSASPDAPPTPSSAS